MQRTCISSHHPAPHNSASHARLPTSNLYPTPPARTARRSHRGVLSLRFLGVMKVLALCVLTAGYGWMAHFEKPSAYELPRDM